MARQAAEYFLRQDHPRPRAGRRRARDHALAGVLPRSRSDPRRPGGRGVEHRRPPQPGLRARPRRRCGAVGRRRLARAAAALAPARTDPRAPGRHHCAARRGVLRPATVGVRPLGRRAAPEDVPPRRARWHVSLPSLGSGSGSPGLPDRSLAEDAAFLDRAVRRGARLAVLPAEAVVRLVRHGANSWGVDPARPAGAAALPGTVATRAGTAVSACRSPAAPAPVPVPLSCIMPTHNRRRFVPGRDRVVPAPGLPGARAARPRRRDRSRRGPRADDPRIAYHRLDRRVVLGAKRNLACELAKGSHIAHWDDDDWQAPQRLSRQMAACVDGGHDLCGSASVTFWSPAAAAAWTYTWPSRTRIWAAATPSSTPEALVPVTFPGGRDR